MSVSAHSRSKGHSATAAAAYRACERIVDERTGEIHDYRRKGGLVVAELFTPPGVSWSGSRADLWNAAERAETYKNACVAREHLVALPHELDEGQRLELVREYARDLAQRHGCAVDAAIHDADEGGNVHAHVLCSTRELTADGFGEKCAREKTGRKRSADLKAERIRWEVLANGALERAGRPERIDHRSHQERGLLDLPTVHVGHGPGAAARAAHNAEVRELNQAMRQALQERAQEAARIKAAEAEAFARTSVVFRPMEATARPPEPTQAPEPEPVDLDELRAEIRRIDEADAKRTRHLADLKASMETAPTRDTVRKAGQRAKQLAERARRERAALADLKGERAGLSWWGRLTRAGRLDDQIKQAQAQLTATCKDGRRATATAEARSREDLQAQTQAIEREREAAKARRDAIVALATAERARLAGLHLPRTPTPGTRAAKA